MNEEPMGKRRRQQNGFYSSLLKGEGAGKAGKRKLTNDCLPTGIAAQEESAQRKDSDSGVPVKSADIPFIVEDSVSTSKRVRKQTRDKDADKSPAALQHGASKEGMASALAGSKTKATRQEREDTVVAVVEDDSVSSSLVSELLQGERLPGQRAGGAQVEEREGHVTVRGSIEQVQQALAALAQLKNKRAVTVAVRCDAAEKESRGRESSVCVPARVETHTPHQAEATEGDKREERDTGDDSDREFGLGGCEDDEPPVKFQMEPESDTGTAKDRRMAHNSKTIGVTSPKGVGFQVRVQVPPRLSGATSEPTAADKDAVSPPLGNNETTTTASDVSQRGDAAGSETSAVGHLSLVSRDGGAVVAVVRKKTSTVSGSLRLQLVKGDGDSVPHISLLPSDAERRSPASAPPSSAPPQAFRVRLQGGRGNTAPHISLLPPEDRSSVAAPLPPSSGSGSPVSASESHSLCVVSQCSSSNRTEASDMSSHTVVSPCKSGNHTNASDMSSHNVVSPCKSGNHTDASDMSSHNVVSPCKSDNHTIASDMSSHNVVSQCSSSKQTDLSDVGSHNVVSQCRSSNHTDASDAHSLDTAWHYSDPASAAASHLLKLHGNSKAAADARRARCQASRPATTARVSGSAGEIATTETVLSTEQSGGRDDGTSQAVSRAEASTEGAAVASVGQSGLGPSPVFNFTDPETEARAVVVVDDDYEDGDENNGGYEDDDDDNGTHDIAVKRVTSAELLTQLTEEPSEVIAVSGLPLSVSVSIMHSLSNPKPFSAAWREKPSQRPRRGTAAETNLARSEAGDEPIEVLYSIPEVDTVKRVHCGVCKVKLEGEEEIKRHMEEVHASKDSTFGCDVCHLGFPDKRLLLAHLRKTHEAANLTCQICSKRFQCQRYLRTHLQRHAGVKSFQCPHCHWRFFERHKLKFHLELHKAEQDRSLPYRCERCGKQFANRATWSDHCNTHSGLRPFICDRCGAKFGHRVGLRRHKLTHERVKPFACGQCSKTFSVRPKLLEHMIIHTGVSKHICPTCHKVFTARSSLKRHSSKCVAAPEPDPTLVEDSNPDSNSASGGALPADEAQESDTESYFMCGACNACYRTFREAEEHAMTHVEGPGPTEAPQEQASVGDNNSAKEAPYPKERVFVGDGKSVSVEELEEIQLAANTLADLSGM